MELVSQFTEDTVAQEDRNCDRPACRKCILKNDSCHYVANMIPGQPGRFVCEACFVGYQWKISSSVRPSARCAPLILSQSHSSTSRLLPDPQIIQQSVNATQRKSTINPPPVVPFSQPSGSGMSCTPGPDILVPSSWQQSQNLGQHKVTNAAGYSVYHVQYNLERERYLKLSYAPAETITLEISAVYEGNSRKKYGRGINIGTICEGKKDIDVRIDAPGLINLAFDTVIPKLLVFGNGFPWRINEFTVRDAGWVNLSTHPSHVPYFFLPMLSALSAWAKVTVPAAQWVEYEEWLDKIEEQRHHQPIAQDSPTATSTALEFGRDTDNAGNGDEFWGADDWNSVKDSDMEGTSDVELEGSNNLDSAQDHHTPSLSANDSDSEQDRRTPSLPENDSDSVQDRCAPSLSAKRTHVRAESDSRSSTVSPPHKKVTLSMGKGADVLRLPNCDYLREALKCGGSTNPGVSSKVFDRHHEDVQYYPIPTRSLPEILKTLQYCSFELDISDSSIGQLTIDVPLHSMIGIGAFKTAHPGWLTLSPVVSSGLGSRTQHPVVVKRPFFRVPIQAVATTATASIKITRYSSADELKNVLKESNVMYWAKSLLDYTYDYIDHHISTSSTPPPFEIPRVRFIDAGVALGYGQRTATASAGSRPGAKQADTTGGTVSAIYLLEERISLVITRSLPNEYGYDLAVFLAFMQHIQYVQTEGLAFISDYQGSLTLLTDPQILTHPCVVLHDLGIMHGHDY
ncbi:hypothetical protein DFJ58DRAFT_865615 [Suillus subalutaceus]|uniref:uncharacterized protein n=1 Tax=Suillus subalutaceus TaxID=48586 RepID=UPI001B877DF7|nr:uncharacterized protein DFJ58DRAFT_865615 [Suillus subalutaceus]KAG1876491.1 hypothetical protein DFJ58DRAFT_865615 [Suillus subalutaceus]